MGIGDAILLVSCLAGLMMALPALLIFLNITFMGTSDRAAYRLSFGGIVPFFIGLGFLLVLGGPATLMLAAGSFLQLIGSIVWIVLFFIGFIGMASLSKLIGYRVTQLNERDASPLIQAFAGTSVLAFGIAFPVLGWVIVFPFTFVIGTGAVVIVTARRWLGSDKYAPVNRGV